METHSGETKRAARIKPTRHVPEKLRLLGQIILLRVIAHHTVGGCNLQPGDLIGTGTQSGPGEGEAAALIEQSVGGKQPVSLGNGETRSFLEDGDTVILRAWCERPGFARIGFGECRGTVLAAR